MGRSSLFPLSNSDYPLADKTAKSYGIAPLTKIQRETFVNKEYWRSKMIVRPAMVRIMGIHFVHHFVGDIQGVVFKPSEALVHHYRRRWGKRTALEEDRTMLRFTDTIVRQVQQVMDAVCGHSASMTLHNNKAVTYKLYICYIALALLSRYPSLLLH